MASLSKPSFIRVECGAVNSKLPPPVDERNTQAYQERENQITKVMLETLAAKAAEKGCDTLDDLLAEQGLALIDELEAKILGKETFVDEDLLLPQVLGKLPEAQDPETFKERLELIESVASFPQVNSLTIDPTQAKVLQTWHLARSSEIQKQKRPVPKDHFPGDKASAKFEIPLSHSVSKGSTVPKDLKPLLKTIFERVRNDLNSKSVTIGTDKGTVCFRRTPLSFKHRPVTPFCLEDED